MLAQRAALLERTGRIEGATAAVDLAMRAAEACGDPAALLEAIRARTALLPTPEHVAERLRLGDRALALAPAVGSPTSALWGHLWRLDASYELEAMDAAAAEIDAVEALVERTRLPLVRWHLLRMQASAAGRRFATASILTVLAVELGDHELMRRLFDLLLPFAAYSGGPGSGTVLFQGAITRYLGDLALGLGRVDAAVQHYEDALRRNTRMGGRPFVVLSRLGLAEARCARARPGDLDAADALVTAVVSEARRLDMPGSLERAARLRATLREADPLSAREREVTALVAEGRATARSPGAWSCRSARSRPTSATSWPSSASRPAPRSPRP